MRDVEISKGEVYTIRWAGHYTSPVNAVTVYCVRLDRVTRDDGKDAPYAAIRFRPLESDAIKLFRKIAEDVSNGKVLEIVDV